MFAAAFIKLCGCSDGFSEAMLLHRHVILWERVGRGSSYAPSKETSGASVRSGRTPLIKWNVSQMPIHYIRKEDGTVSCHSLLTNKPEENNSLSEQIPQILLWPTLSRCSLRGQYWAKIWISSESKWTFASWMFPVVNLHQFMNDGYWTKPTHASVAWSLGLTTCQNLSVWVRRYFRSRITSAAYPDICRASTHASVVTGAFDTLQNRPSIKDDTYLKTVTEDIFLKLYCVWLRILISNLGFFWHWTSLLEWWLKVLDMATITISSL